MRKRAGEQAALTVWSGTVSNAPTGFGLFDGAVRWLTLWGRTGQRDTALDSKGPKRVLQSERYGDVVGAMVLPDAPDGMSVSGVPELCVVGLVFGRQAAAHGANPPEATQEKGSGAGVPYPVAARADCPRRHP